MPKLRIVGIVVAVAALAVTAAPAVVPAKSKPATCKRSKSTTVVANAVARIFTRPDDSQSAGGRELLGCWKRTGRTTVLATRYDDELYLSGQFALVRLRGRFAAYYTENVDISCKADCPQDYDATRRALNVVDLRRGSGFDVGVAESPAGNRLLLDAHGAIAWPRWLEHDQVEIRVRDGEGERALDSGAIHPESLMLSAGGQLRWINDGNARSARLEH